MDGLRRILFSLRPVSLERYGLVKGVAQYCESFQSQTGIHVELVSFLPEGERLPSEIEGTLYRVIQEGLTNVARHADTASAGVIIERRDDEVVVTVEDAGAGFDLAEAERKGHFGLVGMRERLELLGGRLTVTTAPGNGTTLIAAIQASDAVEETVA